eukprot:scaffold4916_cov371-Prasinococcus_capsulatus_cf.AAC.6
MGKKRRSRQVSTFPESPTAKLPAQDGSPTSGEIAVGRSSLLTVNADNVTSTKVSQRSGADLASETEASSTEFQPLSAASYARRWQAMLSDFLFGTPARREPPAEGATIASESTAVEKASPGISVTLDTPRGTHDVSAPTWRARHLRIIGSDQLRTRMHNGLFIGMLLLVALVVANVVLDALHLQDDLWRAHLTFFCRFYGTPAGMCGVWRLRPLLGPGSSWCECAGYVL